MHLVLQPLDGRHKYTKDVSTSNCVPSIEHEDGIPENSIPAASIPQADIQVVANICCDALLATGANSPKECALNIAKESHEQGSQAVFGTVVGQKRSVLARHSTPFKERTLAMSEVYQFAL